MNFKTIFLFFVAVFVFFNTSIVNALVFIDDNNIRDDELIDQYKYLYRKTIAGDTFNPANGKVDFTVTDVDLPGNNDLPVRLERWIPDSDMRVGGQGPKWPGSVWQWKLPLIRGYYADRIEGASAIGFNFFDWGWRVGENCNSVHPFSGGGVDQWQDSYGIYPQQFWEGVLLHIPGKTTEKFLENDLEDGSIQQITKSNYIVDKCVYNDDSREQGFEVLGPDGIRYIFNQVKSYQENYLFDADGNPMGADGLKTGRFVKLILITSIQDRFGNTVSYHYDDQGDLTSIEASDGRKIEIAYQTHTDELGVTKKLPAHATANGRMWTYNYHYYPCNEYACGLYLESVDLPGEAGSWKYSDIARSIGYRIPGSYPWLRINDSPDYHSSKDSEAGLCQLFEWIDDEGLTAQITTPAGIVNRYRFEPTYQGRSKVNPEIFRILRDTLSVPYNDALSSPQALYWQYYATNINCSADYALVEKTSTLPGGEVLEWGYEYSKNVGSYVNDDVFFDKVRNIQGEKKLSVPQGLPNNLADPEDYRSVTVIDKNKKQYFYIDRKFQSPTEGNIVAEDITSKSGVLLQRKEFLFSQEGFVGHHWYRYFYNVTEKDPQENSLNANSLQYRINKSQDKVYTYHSDGVDVYTVNYLDYDNYGNLLKNSEKNNFSADNRYTKFGVINDVDHWLLGMPVSTAVSANDSDYVTVEEIVYHTEENTGLYDGWYVPYEYKEYGNWVRRYPEFHTDSTEPMALGKVKRIEVNAKLKKTDSEVSTLNRYQELTNYKAGKPQLVTMASRYNDSDTMSFSRTIDDNGWVTQIVDLNGSLADYGYDDFGRLRYVDLPDEWADYLVNWGWNDNGAEQRTAKRCRLNGALNGCLSGTERLKTVTNFDGYMRVADSVDTDIENNTSRYQTFEYDIDNRPTFSSRVSANRPSDDNKDGVYKTYDGLGRLKTETESFGGVNTYEYLSGNRVQFTDANSNVTTIQYQAYGNPDYSQPLIIWSPESVSTHFSVNLFGDIEEITQTGPNKSGSGVLSQTEYRTYDVMHNLCKLSREDVGTSVYSNNLLGEVEWLATGVVSHSNGTCDADVDDGQRVTNLYDNTGAIWKVSYTDDSPNLTYTADNVGNITDLVAGDVVHAYFYNELGLLENENFSLDGRTWLLDYYYDTLGSLQALTYPDGDTVSLVPNAFGSPSQVKREAREGREVFTYVNDVSYYPSGQVDSFTYGNGLQHKTTLNSRNLPQQIHDFRSTYSALKYSYTYDYINNIKSLRDELDTAYSLTNLNYDGLNRLTETTGGAAIGSSSIRYDGLGNITFYASKNSVLDYSYVNHQLKTVTGSGSAAKNYQFSYDNRGNVINNGARSFTFNQAGQLYKSLNNRYVYDGHNRRVKTQDSNVIGYSFYSQSGQLLYREIAGKGINYIYLGNRLIAKDGIIPVDSGKQHNRPFGGSIEGEIDDVGYTGHKFDMDLGLSYMQARYYDPVIGRFLSNDPVGFLGHMNGTQGVQGFNRYAYANNNPYKYVDPDGREVTITIDRDTYTEDSITGTVSVESTVTDDTFDGFSLEQRTLANANLPVGEGTYTTFQRTDHNPNRVELEDVDGADNVQIHVGNDTDDVEGCFAVGTSRSADFVGGSVTAMDSINNIIDADGGDVSVVVNGGRDPAIENKAN